MTQKRMFVEPTLQEEFSLAVGTLEGLIPLVSGK